MRLYSTPRVALHPYWSSPFLTLPYFPRQYINISVILASTQIFRHRQLQLGDSKRLAIACPDVRHRSSLGIKYTDGNVDFAALIREHAIHVRLSIVYPVVMHLPNQRITLECSTFHLLVSFLIGESEQINPCIKCITSNIKVCCAAGFPLGLIHLLDHVKSVHTSQSGVREDVLWFNS